VAYVGNTPSRGQWRKLTDISGSFNGVTTTFTTSVPPGTSQYHVTAGTASQLIISVGGVIQQPDVDYSVSTNSITFTTAPAAGLSFYGILCGDALNTGVPSDGSITTAKLGGNLTVDLASGTAADPSLTFDTNTGLYSPGEDQVAVSTGGTERFRVDASGRLLVGISAAADPDSSIETSKDGENRIRLTTYADANIPQFVMARARGSQASPTIVQNGNTISTLTFRGYDGANFFSAAKIDIAADGAPSTGSMPGRFLVSTTPSGTTTPIERLRVASDGLITLSANAGLSISKTGVTAPAATDGNVYSGTYTPTLTNITNVASSTAVTCQYMRVGNVVTVSGQVVIQATTGGSASAIGVSLPIASDLSALRQLAGSLGTSASYTTATIYGDLTNDRATFYITIPDTTSRNYFFHFTYLVV